MVIIVIVILGGVLIWKSYPPQAPVAYNLPANTNVAENTPTIPPPVIPTAPTNNNAPVVLPPPINGPVMPPLVPITPGKSTYLNTVSDAKLGARLASYDGMSLYYFTKDAANVSNCTGNCVTIWPPYTVGSDVIPVGDSKATGRIGTIKRADGSMQLTYNGVPLYKYFQDKAPLDTNGQGVGGFWFVVKP